MMVEAGAEEVPESVILDAIMFAHEEIKKIVEFIEAIVAEVGKPKMEIDFIRIPEDIEAAVRDYGGKQDACGNTDYDKMERLDNRMLLKLRQKSILKRFIRITAKT